MSFGTFRYEIEEAKDETDKLTTTVHCHGRVLSENTAELRALVSPMIVRGGHIVLDFSGVSYMDSSGLGAIVGLKVSSINRGLGDIDLVNMTPRVRNLLSLTRVEILFEPE
jgi:anti-anti-sigma factor